MATAHGARTAIATVTRSFSTIASPGAAVWRSSSPAPPCSTPHCASVSARRDRSSCGRRGRIGMRSREWWTRIERLVGWPGQPHLKCENTADHQFRRCGAPPGGHVGLVEATFGLAEATNGLVEAMNGLAEATNGLAEATNGLAEATNGLAETTNGLAESTNGLAEAMNGLAEAT